MRNMRNIKGLGYISLCPGSRHELLQAKYSISDPEMSQT